MNGEMLKLLMKISLLKTRGDNMKFKFKDLLLPALDAYNPVGSSNMEKSHEAYKGMYQLSEPSRTVQKHYEAPSLGTSFSDPNRKAEPAATYLGTPGENYGAYWGSSTCDEAKISCWNVNVHTRVIKRN